MNRLLSPAFCLALFLIPLASHALPVLRESAGAYQGNFVTIYPDHRNPNLYYFLPNKIDFAKDPRTGVPSFSLNTYGVEQSNLEAAGGWMTFVFQAAVSAEVRAALDEFLRTHPGAQLTTLPIGESYLTVGKSRDGIPSDAAKKFFSSWELPPAGGVLESEVGGNGYLTGLGAKIMTNAIRNSVAYELNYCFRVDGVTPYMDAKVIIDYHKAFEHFKAKASGGWWIFGADVSREVQTLVENGAITIELHGDTKFEDVILQMAQDLARQYLKPTLENPALNESGGGLFSIFRLVRFGFNSTAVEERRRVELSIRKQADLTDLRCIAAPLRSLAPYANQIIQNTVL
jgi:hypothetical protein